MGRAGRWAVLVAASGVVGCSDPGTTGAGRAPNDPIQGAALPALAAPVCEGSASQRLADLRDGERVSVPTADGAFVLLNTVDGESLLLDVGTGERIPLRPHQIPLGATPDHRKVVLSSWDPAWGVERRTLLELDVATRQTRTLLETTSLTSWRYQPGDPLLATTQDSVSIFDPRTLTFTEVISGDGVSGARWRDAGVVVAGAGDTATVFELATHTKRQFQPVALLEVIAPGVYLGARPDGTLFGWTVEHGFAELGRTRVPVTDRFDPEARLVGYGSVKGREARHTLLWTEGGEIFVWDRERGERIDFGENVIPEANAAVTTVVLQHHDGFSRCLRFERWDAATRTTVPLAHPEGTCAPPAVSADGTRIVTQTQSLGTGLLDVRMWDAASATEIPLQPRPAAPRAVGFVGDGRWLVVLDNASPRLYRAADGQEVGAVPSGADALEWGEDDAAYLWKRSRDPYRLAGAWGLQLGSELPVLLGRSVEPGCQPGWVGRGFRLFGRDLDDAPELVGWSPGAGALTRYAEGPLLVKRCDVETGFAAVLERLHLASPSQPPILDGALFAAGRFVLVDLDRACRVPSTDGARWVQPIGGGYLVATDDALWKVTAGR